MAPPDLHQRGKARHERELEGCRSGLLDTLKVSALSLAFGFGAAQLERVEKLRRRLGLEPAMPRARRTKSSLCKPAGSGADGKDNERIEKGLIWARNTARMSSTGKIFSTGTKYGHALIDALNDGAPTLEAAHGKASRMLRKSKEVLDQDEAKDLRELGLRASPGKCTERPAVMLGEGYSGITRGVPTYALILVGPEYSEKKDIIGFDRQALRLRDAFEKAFDARVMIARASSAKAIHAAIRRLGKLADGGQAVLYLSGHGYFTPVDDGGGKSWASRSNGEFLCGEVNSSATSERALRKSINHLSRHFENIAVLFDCCHSESFLE